jgi:hypothetical protein
MAPDGFYNPFGMWSSMTWNPHHSATEGARRFEREQKCLLAYDRNMSPARHSAFVLLPSCIAGEWRRIGPFGDIHAYIVPDTSGSPQTDLCQSGTIWG